MSLLIHRSIIKIISGTTIRSTFKSDNKVYVPKHIRNTFVNDSKDQRW